MEDEEEEEQARQTMKENKLYGFKLQYIKIGDFVPKYWYPHQFRVRANTLDEQLEISFFRYTARPLPKALAKYGLKPSKQLSKYILTECARFEVSRKLRIVIPFSSIAGIHVYDGNRGEGMAVERWGFVAFDLSSLPIFQTCRVNSLASIQNVWRERSDFTKNKQASTTSRYYLFGDNKELITLIAMMGISKPEPFKAMIDRGMPNVGAPGAAFPPSSDTDSKASLRKRRRGEVCGNLTLLRQGNRCLKK